MIRLPTALIFVPFILLAACSLSPEPRGLPIGDDVRYARGERIMHLCFGQQVQGFSPRSDNELILSLRDGREYLVSTSLCDALEDAQRIALLQHTACLSTGDSLSVAERFKPAYPRRAEQRCRILSIHEWQPAEAQENG